MLTRETLEKIEEMCDPFVHELDGENYVITKDGDVTRIRPEPDYATILNLNSLDALIQMARTEALELYKPPIYIKAGRYDAVTCFLQPDKELLYHRQILYTVEATDVSGWEESDDLPFEKALIAIRTCFQQSSDTEYLLRLLSEITNKAKVTYADNGVATSILTQKGVALQSAETIRPIVSLRPYRTFQEIDQPASEFHIRISERGIRFIEADGGMWKLTARRSIVDYIKEHLDDAVGEGRVVVML